MAYPMYNNNNQFYMQDLQAMKDRIDSQMRQLQQQNQVQQPQIPQVNQTFQLAPNPTNNELESKYANNIDEVKNTFVMKTGLFTNKDFSLFWVKDVTGNIRTFKTEEIIEMDSKDKEILLLKKQIKEMKEMINYDNKSDGNSTNIDGTNENKNAKKLSSRTKSNAKSE